MGWKSVFFSVLTLASVGQHGIAQIQTDAKAGSSVLTIGGANVFDVIYTRRLGGGEPTQLYKADDAIYYEPALLPNWQGYRSAVDAACSGEPAAEESVPVSLTIFLEDINYRADIIAGLELREDLVGGPVRFHTIPHDIARIRMRVGNEDRIVYPRNDGYLSAIVPGYSEARQVGLSEEVKVELDFSCSVHRRVLEDVDAGSDRLLSGELYRVDPEYRSTSLHMLSALGLDEKIKAELFSDESVEASVSSSSDAQSLSLNIGIGDLFGVGGIGQTDATASATARRLVTRDVLDEMTSRIVQNSRLECRGVDCAELIKLALPILFERETIDVILARTGDGWAVMDDQLNYVTMTSGKISGELSSKIDATGKQNDTKTITLPKGGTVKNDEIRDAIANATGGGSITLEGPVAVVADVSVVSRDTIDYRMNVSISQSIPVDDKENLVMVKFLYPAAVYAEGRIAPSIRRVDDETLRAQCEAGSHRINHTAKESARSPSQNSPYQKINVTATAESGYYIESWSESSSGHNSAALRSSQSLMKLGEGNALKIEGVFQSASYEFKCHRGNSWERRRCNITGNVHTIQQPMKCAPYMIHNFRVLGGMD